MRTVSRWTIGAALAAAFTTFGSFSFAQVKVPAREAAADLPGVHLWFNDSGGSGETGRVRPRRDRQQQSLGVSAPGVRVARLSRDHLRPARLRTIAGRLVGPAAGNRRRRSERADGLPQDRSLPSGRHRGGRFCGVGLRALVTRSGSAVSSSPTALAAFRIPSIRKQCRGSERQTFSRCLQTCVSWDPPIACPTRPALNDGENWSEPRGRPARSRPLKRSATESHLRCSRRSTVPTLLLTGDADMYAPPPIMRMFAAHVKGSKTAVIPEAGHSGYWEQPEIFNRTVLDFIRGH